jgi:hypothetical protein
LLQCLARLSDQPSILDRDHRLRREVQHQGDLLVGEWTDLLACQLKDADRRVVSKQRYAEQRSSTPGFDSRKCKRELVPVGFGQPHIGDLDRRSLL